MFEELKNDEFLMKLSKACLSSGHTLYVVGGCVRDLFIKGNFSGDIDICSSISLEELKIILETAGAAIKVKNKKLETAEITNGSMVYEFARLREEEYGKNINHTPTSVNFITDVYKDAKRRDFTINSLYYDTYNNKIIDPTGGTNDVKHKIIKAVISPNESFIKDPARILRLVDLYARLNFKIEKNTLMEAIQNAKMVYKLTSARRKIELDRIRANVKTEEQQNRIYCLLKKLGLDDILL